jgi:hypothetical protein
MRVALLLLYCCGLRRGELLKLRLADIDTEQQLLRIQQTKCRTASSGHWRVGLSLGRPRESPDKPLHAS